MSEDLRAIAGTLIRTHEGKRLDVYIDTEGYPSIGIGFCLGLPESRQLFEKYLPGVNFDSVLNKTLWLTDAQVEALFEPSLDQAMQDAADCVSNFHELSVGAQAALVDMAYELGKTKLSKFKKAITLLVSEHYAEAAAEFRNSAWFRQVPKRALTDTRLIEGAGTTDEQTETA